MDLAELIDLGKRLGLSGDELTEWALEEQRLWREEIALDIEAAKRLAEIEKERVEIEKKTLKLRQQLAELEATRNQLSPPLDVARDANEHRELDVTVEHQAALSSRDKETSLSLSPQVAALHLTLSGFVRMTGWDKSAPVPPATHMTVGYVVQQQWVPKSFYGEPFEDAEDWLDQFECVARFNGWNEQRKLHNAYYSLEESARTWFDNNEAAMTSWEAFRQRLLATYVSMDRKEKAEIALQARNQCSNQSIAMCVEYMVSLFRRADPSMSEDKKLRHLMHGVKQEIFAGLMRGPPATVPGLVEEATAIERALQQRARKYSRREAAVSGTNVLTALEGNVDGLYELVRRIVREELQAMLHGGVPRPTVSVSELVRDEIRRPVRVPGPADEYARPALPRSTYAETLRQSRYCPPPTIATFEPQPTAVNLMPRPAAPRPAVLY
ncbi:hypothetical protein HPB48_009323 [Haemaphysalis longicornis]|uniref:Retrotransposon gag domain-containing protein n=1 Tax=Haemaphysalis longicornis TaxID=44386 RepID=A0A9J6GCE8_HAELO|nr:hypothetical protein HPB48_009323 [Haemaphysalis longicornis]